MKPPSGLRALSCRPSLLIPVAAVAGTMAYAMLPLGRHTIRVVKAEGLLPRWDLSAHLMHGWVDYSLLASGRIPQFLQDLWFQGYWPPGLSLIQIPFYFVLGPDLTSGLWAAPVAFVLVGVLGSAWLSQEWGDSAILPSALFVSLLVSSPFLLAYASVTMTETVGALAQMFVLFCYARFRYRPSATTARLFAVSLTCLFFTKYNYFLMLAAPLGLYEWLAYTSGWSAARRLATAWQWIRRALSSYTGALLALYFILVLIVTRTGGFEFRAFGERVLVHGIGNSAHIVLYSLLVRLWYLHRLGRIDWHRLIAADLRVRPVLTWFVLPVTIWLASPYPNHLRDFVNLVLNHPMGEPDLRAGLATYSDALRSTYFFAEWVLAFVAILFLTAALAYRRQPPVMQWLIVAIPLQFAAIALHQTRFPRFLLLTVILLSLAASSEVGRWLARSRGGRAAGLVLAPVLVLSGLMAQRSVLGEDRFRALAFEHYTDSDALRSALGTLREGLGPGDRLAIIGHSDALSPALFRAELGPPKGVPCFPYELGGSRRLDLALATQALLLVPLGPDSATLNRTSYYPAQRDALLAQAKRGEFTLRREFRLEDLGVSLLLYHRTTHVERAVDCR